MRRVTAVLIGDTGPLAAPAATGSSAPAGRTPARAQPPNRGRRLLLLGAAAVALGGGGGLAALRLRDDEPQLAYLTLATGPKGAVYVEVGSRRVFAGALDWPGWCRTARDEDAALQALVSYGPRYAAAIGPLARELAVPSDTSGLDVVERLEGNATTDFGAPAVAPAADDRPLDGAELERLLALLQACWTAFDQACETASLAVLRKGPRGGGRDVEAIVSHIFEADRAYLSLLWSASRKAGEPEPATEMARLRGAILDALGARARGDALPEGRRSTKVWTQRYFVRRSAWHALDHAWEIEDRAKG